MSNSARPGRPTSPLVCVSAALLLALTAHLPAQDAPDALPQIPWQRSLDAALALSAESGRPLLVCVNADGEPASESLAARRYRDPDFLKLMAGFIPVIASAFEHTPRSHDGRGRRIPCPRFGTITCEEHITIEPLAYERWFAGRRVAPRHVGVDPDGKVLFDLYLLQTLQIIDTTLRDEGRKGKRLPDPRRMSERQLLESLDARADERLEEMFLEASEGARIRTVSSSLDSTRLAQHPELVRLGLADASPLVRQAAAERAAASAPDLPADILENAARLLHDSDVLVERIADDLAGREDPSTQRRGLVLRASREPSEVLDVETWIPKLAVIDTEATAEDDARALNELTVRLDGEVAASPEDDALRSRLARAYLDLSRARVAEGESDVRYLWDLAHEEARRVASRPGAPAVAQAVFARTEWLLGGPATEAAPAAALALPGLFGEARSRLTAETLDVLVQARAEQAFDALDAAESPEAAWISDVVAGAQLLVRHPMATAWQRAAALDVLASLRLDGVHTELAWLGATLHPAAPEMHEHLRWHLLRDGDAAAVGAAYESLESKVASDVQPTVQWFAAFARLQAGDRLREEQRIEEAASSYRSSLEGFATATSKDASLTNTAAYVTLAHSGLARLLLASGDPVGAAEDLLEGLEQDPAALDVPDSLGVTPRATVVETIRRLPSEQGALRARLDAVLES